MEAMNLEPPKRRVRLRLWILALLLIIVASGLLRWAVPPTDTVTFWVVDATTGELLRHARASGHVEWTSLRVERLGIQGLSRWRSTRLKDVNGSFEIPGIPRRSSSSLAMIKFTCTGYNAAAFMAKDDGYRVIYSGASGFSFPRTNSVTIPLFPATAPKAQKH